MKKHNIEIVKMLRKNATPMNNSDLQDWLETNLIASDISATVSSCIDGKGFVAHEIELSDTHGANRSFTVPTLADSFTFEANGIYNKYGIISPKAQVGSKNMYVVSHEGGYVLVSYKTMIGFYHVEQNTVYFKRHAFCHSVTTAIHIYEFLTNFVNANASKMFAK